MSIDCIEIEYGLYKTEYRPFLEIEYRLYRKRVETITIKPNNFVFYIDISSELRCGPKRNKIVKTIFFNFECININGIK